MVVQASLAEAADRLDELVDAVLAGEEVFLVEDGRIVVRLDPVKPQGLHQDETK